MAQADPLGLVDYEYLIANHDLATVDEAGIPRLDLPDGVSLIGMGDGRIAVRDSTDFCPLGQATMLLMVTIVAGETCEGLLSDEEIARLRGVLDVAVILYAEGMQPEPVSQTLVQDRISQEFEVYSSQITCDFVAHPSRKQTYLTVSNELTIESLGRARLAVWTPPRCG